MTEYLNLYNLQREKIAVLENAYNIEEEKELNAIYGLKFSLPSSDPKITMCQAMRFVRYGDTGEMYRIIKSSAADADISTNTFICEHVIATLCDTVLFGSYVYGGQGVGTAQVINWILSKQNVQNWQLIRCDFDLNYEYNWEQENLLNALYSIPKEFVDPYRWEFDTTIYPCGLSLIKIGEAEDPDYYIAAGKNLLGRNVNTDNTQICTRIYPLGYGEGINQLTIRDVNPNKDAEGKGLPYLEAEAATIEQYGIIEKVLVDRQFESPETLMAYGQTVLNNLKVPTLERSFDVADLYPITKQPIDRADVGKVCLLTEDGTLAYIKKTVRVLDDPGSLTLDLSTKTSGIVNTIADLADRVRIESVYAQGATQIYQHAKDANAGTTVENGHVLSLYFPKEMKQINKVLLKLQLKKFRMYNKSTENSEAQSSTSEDGGGSTSTSAAGGGNISIYVGATENANWKYPLIPYTEATQISIACNQAGEHKHWIWGDTGTVTPPASDNYRHYHAMNFDSQQNDSYGNSPKHRHDVYESTNGGDGHWHYVPRNRLQHDHQINVMNSAQSMSGFQHTHSVSIPKHSHSFTIPAHDHSISPGIFEASETPTSFGIYVGGQLKINIESKTYEADITEYLLDETGLIPRDRWITVTIVPNKLAYIVSSVFVQGFVQSRGGGNY